MYKFILLFATLTLGHDLAYFREKKQVQLSGLKKLTHISQIKTACLKKKKIKSGMKQLHDFHYPLLHIF